MSTTVQSPAGELILLKLGELVLKGLNRRGFEDKLMGNAKKSLRPYGNFRVYSRQSTTYVEPQDENCDLDGAYTAMCKLFGVAGLHRAKACEKTPEAMVETAKSYLYDPLINARHF